MLLKGYLIVTFILIAIVNDAAAASKKDKVDKAKPKKGIKGRVVDDTLDEGDGKARKENDPILGGNSTTPPTGAPSGPPKSKLYPANKNRLDIMKEKYCPLIPQMGRGPENKIPKWNDEMKRDEIFELALLNMGYGLSNDAISQLTRDLGYKRKIIDMIAYITRTTCQTPAISTNYLNVAKNLFLYYLIKRGNKKVPPKDSTETDDEDEIVTKPPTPIKKRNFTKEWDEILDAVATCAAEVAPIRFHEVCGDVDGYYGPGPDGQLTDPSMVREGLDDELDRDPYENVDIIIDSIWWMFSTTYARCYAYFYPEEDVMLTFYQRFKEDILSPFNQRWVKAGQHYQHFPIIFGPMSIFNESKNLRTCTAGAYDFEDLGGRQLVRPLILDRDGVPIRNYKISMADDSSNVWGQYGTK